VEPEPAAPVTPAEPAAEGTTPEPVETADSLDDMDYDELQAEAKRRDIPANGKHSVLLERIKAHDAAPAAE
jgi:hypothetical protein